MRRALFGLALVAVAAAAPAGRPVRAVDPGPFGLWRNPDGSLVVRLEPCADRLCGVIAWASPAAIADAHDSGIAQPLVGTQLLIDYRPAGVGIWRGRVYVPDMGGTFLSKIVRKSADALDISGCVLGGLICKHQTWHRA